MERTSNTHEYIKGKFTYIGYGIHMVFLGMRSKNMWEIYVNSILGNWVCIPIFTYYIILLVKVFTWFS